MLITTLPKNFREYRVLLEEMIKRLEGSTAKLEETRTKLEETNVKLEDRVGRPGNSEKLDKNSEKLDKNSVDLAKKNRLMGMFRARMSKIEDLVAKEDIVVTQISSNDEIQKTAEKVLNEVLSMVYAEPDAPKEGEYDTIVMKMEALYEPLLHDSIPKSLRDKVGELEDAHHKFFCSEDKLHGHIESHLKRGVSIGQRIFVFLVPLQVIALGVISTLASIKAWGTSLLDDVMTNSSTTMSADTMTSSATTMLAVADEALSASKHSYL